MGRERFFTPHWDTGRMCGKILNIKNTSSAALNGPLDGNAAIQHLKTGRFMKPFLFTAFSIFLFALSLFSAEVISEQESKEGFKPLFNEKELTRWKLRRAEGSNSWKVENG